MTFFECKSDRERPLRKGNQMKENLISPFQIYVFLKGFNLKFTVRKCAVAPLRSLNSGSVNILKRVNQREGFTDEITYFRMESFSWATASDAGETDSLYHQSFPGTHDHCEDILWYKVKLKTLCQCTISPSALLKSSLVCQRCPK